MGFGNFLTKFGVSIDDWFNSGGHAQQHAGMGVASVGRLRELFAAAPVSLSGVSVMAMPPTITQQSGGLHPAAWATPLANAQLIKIMPASVVDSRVLLNVASPAVALTAGYNDGSTYQFLKSSSVGGTTGLLIAKIKTDSPYMGIACAGNFGGQIYVDGQAVSASNLAYAVSGSTRWYLTLAFSARQMREIVVVYSPNTGLGGFAVGPSDTVMQSQRSALTWTHEGDSYSQASTTNGVWSGLAARVPLALGISKYSAAPVGGTGFQATNSLSRAIDRISNMTGILGFSPTVCSVMLGINDQGLSGNQAYTDAYFQALRSALPQTLFIVFDPWCPNQNNVASYQSTIGNAVTASVKAAGALWILIHSMSGTWETSWGTSGTTGGVPFQTGDGRQLTATAALTAATSMTLTSAWTGTTGAYNLGFSDGTVKSGVTLTNGSTAVSWVGAVTASASVEMWNTIRGNAGFYVSADGTHPTPAGYDYLSECAYSAIRDAVMSFSA